VVVVVLVTVAVPPLRGRPTTTGATASAPAGTRHSCKMLDLSSGIDALTTQ
jgi:hypothetical protein